MPSPYLQASSFSGIREGPHPEMDGVSKANFEREWEHDPDPTHPTNTYTDVEIDWSQIETMPIFLQPEELYWQYRLEEDLAAMAEAEEIRWQMALQAEIEQIEAAEKKADRNAGQQFWNFAQAANEPYYAYDRMA